MLRYHLRIRQIIPAGRRQVPKDILTGTLAQTLLERGGPDGVLPFFDYIKGDILVYRGDAGHGTLAGIYLSAAAGPDLRRKGVADAILRQELLLDMVFLFRWIFNLDLFTYGGLGLKRGL